MTRPLTNRRIVGLITAVTLVLGAIATSTAGARPIDTGPLPLSVAAAQIPDPGSVPQNSNAYADVVNPAPVAASAGNDSGDTNGFDYGAAGVGAGVIAGIAVLIAAGGLAIRRRSQPEHT